MISIIGSGQVRDEVRILERISFRTILLNLCFTLSFILLLIITTQLLLYNSLYIAHYFPLIGLFSLISVPVVYLQAFRDRTRYIFYKDRVKISNRKIFFKIEQVIFYNEIKSTRVINGYSMLMWLNRDQRKYVRSKISSRFDDRLLLVDLKDDHRALFHGKIMTVDEIRKLTREANVEWHYGTHYALSFRTIQKYREMGYDFP